jgi:hypothetical protein
MGNELTSICNTIYNTISNFLIDDDYKIDNDYKIDDILKWSELCQIYIMRYRRVIGIFMLIILLGILRYCNWEEVNDSSTLQTGGGNHSASVDAELSRLRAVHEAQTKFDKEKSEKAKADAKAAEEKSKAETASKLAAAKEAKAASRGKLSKKVHKLGSKIKDSGLGKAVGKASNAVAESKVGQAIGESKLGQKYSAMREAGMSRFGSGLELTRQGGQFVADKFKEFANWLYEILFAIAISIAICMIVVPSIAFFALGLICYFLLRKKISSMKAF